MIVRENLPHELDERANTHFVQNYLEFKKQFSLEVQHLYSYAIESCKDMCCTVLSPDISSPGIVYKDFAGYRFSVFIRQNGVVQHRHFEHFIIDIDSFASNQK